MAHTHDPVSQHAWHGSTYIQELPLLFLFPYQTTARTRPHMGPVGAWSGTPLHVDTHAHTRARTHNNTGSGVLLTHTQTRTHKHTCFTYFRCASRIITESVRGRLEAVVFR